MTDVPAGAHARPDTTAAPTGLAARAGFVLPQAAGAFDRARQSPPDRSAILPNVAQQGRTRGPGAAAAAAPSRYPGRIP